MTTGPTLVTAAGLVLVGASIVLVLGRTTTAPGPAVLLGPAMILHGIVEVAVSAPVAKAGAEAVAFILGGVGAIVWPDLALHLVALITGMVLVMTASLRVTTGFLSRPGRGWAWSVLVGLATGVVGLAILSWPDSLSTVVVLVLVGLRAAIADVGLLRRAAGAARLRRDAVGPGR